MPPTSMIHRAGINKRATTPIPTQRSTTKDTPLGIIITRLLPSRLSECPYWGLVCSQSTFAIEAKNAQHKTAPAGVGQGGLGSPLLSLLHNCGYHVAAGICHRCASGALCAIQGSYQDGQDLSRGLLYTYGCSQTHRPGDSVSLECYITGTGPRQSRVRNSSSLYACQGWRSILIKNRFAHICYTTQHLSTEYSESQLKTVYYFPLNGTPIHSCLPQGNTNKPRHVPGLFTKHHAFTPKIVYFLP
jgi:hypothetical protein